MKTTAYLIANAAIISIVVLWFYMRWNQRHINRLFTKLRGPKAYPIIGMAHNFIGTQQQIMEKIIEIIYDYGSEPIKFWFGPYVVVGIIKPEDLQIILNNSVALQKDWVYCFLKKIFGESIFTAPVDKWRVHRRIINPVFNINQIKQFIPIFHEKTQILIRNLQTKVGNSQQFDLEHYITPINLGIICNTTMGYDHGPESYSEYELFIENFTRALELTAIRMYKPWYHLDVIFSIYLRLIGQHDIYEKLKILPDKIIKEKKEIYTKRNIANIASVDKINENENVLKTFMDILLESNVIDGNLSDEEIRDEVITMMTTASESTAIAECLCLLLLAIHPDIQDKVYNEIYEVFGDSDRTITFEDTYKLVYLEQVLKESLRLYPIAPVFVRKLQGDVKIFSGGLTLPKGLNCVISPYATHHLPELYPNPWTFDPENFNPENVTKRHRYSFIPFSGGPRGCIGYKYAMLSMKVFVSVFLQNYSVHTDMKLSDIKLKVDMVLRSVHGYPVTIRPRNRVPTYPSS